MEWDDDDVVSQHILTDISREIFFLITNNDL